MRPQLDSSSAVLLVRPMAKVWKRSTLGDQHECPWVSWGDAKSMYPQTASTWTFACCPTHITSDSKICSAEDMPTIEDGYLTSSRWSHGASL
jgi:hypothetical protein